MKYKLLCLAFALLVPVATQAQTTGTLSGKVQDEEGKPIIGAVIRLLPRGGGLSKAPDGSFTIAGIRADDYTVEISAIGYTKESRSIRISVNQTTSLGTIKLTNQAIKGNEIVVRDTRVIQPERVGTVREISREELDRSTRTSIVGAVALTGSVTTAGVNGFSIRGGRATETSIRVDGVEVSDPFSGGFGNTSASLYPTVSTLAVQEIQVVPSGFSAEYGDVLSGVVNSVTRSGRSDRYEGAFRFRTGIPALYGSTSPITVKKAGTDIDTTLPGAKLQGSGSMLYEFGVGGPIPGLDILTFYVSGSLNTYDYIGASYEVYDMSPEYANARRQVAEQVWGAGRALEPMNLGQLPEQEAMIRNLNSKLKLNVSNDIFVELGAEIGLSSVEGGGWATSYRTDNPTFFDTSASGEVTTRVDNSILEREAQQVNENTIINRYVARYFHTLDQGSFLDVTASYVTNAYEAGKKDESKEYGIFDTYDIYEIEDNNNDRIIDRYDSPTGNVILGGQRTNIQLRNPLTGLYEGAESVGASHDPFSVGFPTHGNDRNLDFRSSQTIGLKASYSTNIELGEVKTELKTGFDFATYELRRHYNSLPWVKQPFYDVYGYDAPYFDETKESDRIVKAFLAEPYTPMEGGLYVQGRFDYKSIVFQPGVRFDFVQPNAKKSPLQRSTTEQVARGLNGAEDATLKFQVSPRVGVSYPVTDESQFRVNFAMMFKMPDFNLLFDNAYGSAARGNQVFGNPNIDPQKVFMYEMGYEAQLAEDYSIDVLAYYRDIFNQSGLTFVSAIPSPYLVYTVQEYGNVRGLELTVRRRLVDNITGSINYSLQRAVGTASNPGANYAQLIAGADPYTGEQRTVPLTEYPLSYDQTHSIKGTVSLVWQDNEGPSIGGIQLLENTDITFTGTFGTGLPYTRFNSRGEQIGEYNAERQPSVFGSEAHIEKGFKLADLLGESVGNLEMSVFADITNVLNSTGAIGVYGTSGSPDNNNTTMNRLIGDFTAQPHYRAPIEGRTETFASNQYDRFGERLYNPYADTNLDGVVTQSERYEGYQRYVATLQTLQGNYQRPRTVAVGVKVRF